MKAHLVLHRFNSSLPDETEKRRKMIQALFGAVGANFEVKPPFRCDYGCHIYTKDNLYVNYDCIILDCNKVYFGGNVCACTQSTNLYGISSP